MTFCRHVRASANWFKMTL